MHGALKSEFKMDFSLGYIKSSERVLIRHFSHQKGQDESKTIDIINLEEESLQGLLFDPELKESQEFLESLKSYHKFYPIIESTNFDVDYDSFEVSTKEEVSDSFHQMWSQWLLRNNIGLLDELFTVIEHLKKLLPNDRTTFFEELWFTLKSNLGTSFLKIIYNDVQNNGEKSKNHLIQMKVEGNRTPESKDGGEFEKALMDKYKSHFSTKLDLIEYDSTKGELLATASINKSPVIIMAKTYQLTKVQKSILTCLLEGLNYQL